MYVMLPIHGSIREQRAFISGSCINVQFDDGVLYLEWCALIGISPPGVCPAGSYSISCWLPADPGDRHGHHAGEDHYHKERLHHFSSGGVCPR